ncbi:hypothetical protein BDV3_006518 [Batrachochytrium dendrobatidis]|nr:hypothetical protein QVD99_004528 [Batrachochytrium dendrobatidis]
MAEMTQDEMETMAFHLHDIANDLLSTVQSLDSSTTMTHTTSRKYLTRIRGISKFLTLIKSEQSFLSTLLVNPSRIKPAHVRCSNVPYLSSVLKSVQQENGVASVFHVFKYFPGGNHGSDKQDKPSNIRVDVVAAGGMRWIKVKASNMLSNLEDIETADDESDIDDLDSSDSNSDAAQQSNGDAFNTTAGQSLVLQGKLPLIIRQSLELLEAARQNQMHYTTPTVVIKFLGSNLADQKNAKIVSRLQELGIVVEFGLGSNTEPDMSHTFANATLQDDATDCSTVLTGSMSNETVQKEPSKTHTSFPQLAAQPHNFELDSLTQVLNIDVPTLLALVADTTHRFASINVTGIYDTQAFLKDQARDELDCPILSAMQRVFSNRQLVVTRSAFDKFAKIVDVIGGEMERARSRLIFRKEDVHGSVFDNDRYQQVVPVLSSDIHGVHYFSKMAKIQVIDDDPSERFMEWANKCPRFGMHNVNIFGTGDKLRMTTVTANASAGRTLAEAGFADVSLWLHMPRSLVEQRVLKWINRTQ